MLRYKIILFKNKHGLLQKSRSFATEFDTVVDVFTECFELSTKQANQYIEKEKLQLRESKDIIGSIRFCEGIGFDKKSILEQPALLRCHSNTLDQRFNVLKEGGFTVINPTILGRFLKYSKSQVRLLKNEGLISEDTNVAISFMNNLNPCPKMLRNFSKNESRTFRRIHANVLIKYLAWRLEVSRDRISQMLFIHSTIPNKSFKYLCENIAFAQDLGFSSEKIIKNGFILHSYPKYTKAMVDQYPTIADVPIRKVMRMHPRIIGIQPENIGKIYNILKKYDVTDEAIRRKMGVFLLSPNTIEQRLQEITRLPEFEVFHNDHSFLEFVLHMARAKSRLSVLKELQLRCYGGVSVLAKQDSIFDNYIKESRDKNNIAAIKRFLQKLFKTDASEYFSLLKKHPFYRQISLLSIEDSFLYLKEHGFTEDSILRAIFVLLYSRNKLQQTFKQMKNHELWNRMEMDQVKQLNTAVYFIEQEYHFTGDGVWAKQEVVDT